MKTNCFKIPYQKTGFFSKLVIDYIEGHKDLQQFYRHPVNIEGLKSAVESRRQFATDRPLLVQVLQDQYKGFSLSKIQADHLEALQDENTFTITTAHQPNIFTGHLYFIYKILHTVKLAEKMRAEMPGCRFVPVYYMGSEDADLDELGHVNLDGEKLNWQTGQTGAVGRMKVDAGFLELIDRLAGRLGVLPFGNQLIELFRTAYQKGRMIQDATLHLVHELFKDFGVLVLIPDNAALKAPFNTIVKRELTEQFSQQLVESTIREIGKQYKVQAGGRDINLFYLVDGYRERIEKNQDQFEVKNLQLTWSEKEILAEVDEHPERFSANVILRGIFQEMVLPNIAFIGGGGELAYWLELKSVFQSCNIPFPVLVLRNSFMLINQRQNQLIKKLGIANEDLFKPAQELLNQLVYRDTTNQVLLTHEMETLHQFYAHLQQLAKTVDASLADHVINLERKTSKSVSGLERKMLRAEKRKFEADQRQVEYLKNGLFPGNNLQERVDNFAVYYATYGKEWLQVLLDCSPALEPVFTIMDLPGLPNEDA